MEHGNTFEYTEKTSVKELAEYFLKLADGFKSRSLELHGAGHTIALTPEHKVRLEVKAKTKEDGGELELEISWKHEEMVSEEKLEVTPGQQGESDT
jgi:amphi-Trp domain-containing protein